jgi:hypothetical protein
MLLHLDKPAGIFSDCVQRIILGAVINDNDFIIVILAREDGVQALADRAAAVIIGDVI